LYKIASELNLPEIKLAVFYISNHREDALLMQTWQQILSGGKRFEFHENLT
jgi:predicted transcriptional regulator YdeE